PPAHGLCRVLRRAVPLEVLGAHVVLHRGVALLGGLEVPLQRLADVLADAVAVVVHDADELLGVGIAALGERHEDLVGPGVVALEVGLAALVVALRPGAGSEKKRSNEAEDRDGGRAPRHSPGGALMPWSWPARRSLLHREPGHCVRTAWLYRPGAAPA